MLLSLVTGHLILILTSILLFLAQDPANIFKLAQAFIAANQKNKFLLTVYLPHVDKDWLQVWQWIPAFHVVTVPSMAIIIWRTGNYATSVQWGVNRFQSRHCESLGNNATVVVVSCHST